MFKERESPQGNFALQGENKTQRVHLSKRSPKVILKGGRKTNKQARRHQKCQNKATNDIQTSEVHIVVVIHTALDTKRSLYC